MARLTEADFEDKVEVAKKKAEYSTTSAPGYAKAEYTGEVEWYTPPEYLDLARQVLFGVIDLDPASSTQAQKTVKAEKYYTIEEDGLLQDWNGRIWLNPPYKQPAIFDFCKKMVDEVQNGNVTSAIMLTHNYSDTEWFHLAASACSAICFTRGRIKFVSADGEVAAPTQGQAFFYFGKNQKDFCRVFSEVGLVVLPWQK